MVLLVHMADRRRLQGEIDKTLKKVNEGVDAFDDVWQKLVIVSRLPVQTATNINQKEKYESELKKEIKKLQRLREQIKTWQSSNEIKDKKPLLEARKNIEQQMERFKVIERETKQKPYSKDALGGTYKFDPLHKEQEDLREWLQGCNNKLNSKIEEFETRLEDLNANKKKRMDKEKIELTKTSLETHRHYMETLERIGSMLQKSQLSVKKVQEIKDDVDDFIENSDEPDYSINPDLFEELELDKYDSASAQNDDESNDDEESDDDDEDSEEADENEEEEEEDEPVNNGSTTNHANSNNNNNRNRNRAGSSSGSSASSTSSSVPASNDNTTPTNGTLNTDDEKRRRHKSESGLNQNKDSNNQRNNNGTNNNSNSNSSSNNQNHINSTTNRNRTNSGANTASSSGSSSSTSSSLSNFSSTSKDNKIPPFNSSNSNNVNEINHSSNNNNLADSSQIVPPLSQSPFAAVVAGTANTNTNTAPVSFSAAVLTSSSNNGNTQPNSSNVLTQKQIKQTSINNKDQLPGSISPKDSISNTTLFLTQQQQQLSNLIAAANGSITSLSQLNGLSLPTELDKKLSDVVLNNASPSIPPGVNTNAHMNSLKSMAENAILNLTPQQQQGSLTSLNSQLSNLNTGFLNNVNINNTNATSTNNPTDLPIASLLAVTLQQQQQSGGLTGLSADPNDPNTAAALANLLAQQKGNINLPAALSALQQHQQNFNEQQSRIGGLTVQPSNSNNSNSNNGNSNNNSNNSNNGNSNNNSNNSNTNSNTNNSNSNSGNSQSQQQNISPSLLLNQQQNSTTNNQETFIQPILGVAPLGKTPLTKDQNQQLVVLESAFKKLPHPSDTERMRNYLPRILINTPSYYPMTPPNGHDSIEFLNKLTSDSLFFMFYYMEGTKAQFLAAQALKKLSWRFHTRYMMWFQRFEEPKVITDEYEMGTYVYFDFEKWGQRKKEGFTFEYKYLEDRDLSSY